MKKRTLVELEKAAERQWEEKARRLVQAIAEWENVEFDELYPYLIDYSFGDDYLDAAFKFPEHTLIKLHGGYGTRPPLKLTKKGLEGSYEFMVNLPIEAGGRLFVGCADFGEALLLAHWAHKQDARALWR